MRIIKKILYGPELDYCPDVVVMKGPLASNLWYFNQRCQVAEELWWKADTRLLTCMRRRDLKAARHHLHAAQDFYTANIILRAAGFRDRA